MDVSVTEKSKLGHVQPEGHLILSRVFTVSGESQGSPRIFFFGRKSLCETLVSASRSKNKEDFTDQSSFSATHRRFATWFCCRCFLAFSCGFITVMESGQGEKEDLQKDENMSGARCRRHNASPLDLLTRGYLLERTTMIGGQRSGVHNRRTRTRLPKTQTRATEHNTPQLPNGTAPRNEDHHRQHITFNARKILYFVQVVPSLFCV